MLNLIFSVIHFVNCSKIWAKWRLWSIWMLCGSRTCTWTQYVIVYAISNNSILDSKHANVYSVLADGYAKFFLKNNYYYIIIDFLCILILCFLNNIYFYFISLLNFIHLKNNIQTLYIYLYFIQIF